MKNIRKSVSGFSLIEMLVAVAVLGIISTGIATLMSDASKIQKQVEFKSESLNFRSLLTLSTQKPDFCKMALGITSATPVTVSARDLPGQPNANNTSYDLALPSIQIPGSERYTPTTTTAAGSEVTPGLRLKSLALKFRQPASPGSTAYIASLAFQLEKVNTLTSYGSQNLAAQLPMYVEFVPHKTAAGVPLNDGLLQIDQCYAMTETDPSSQCLALGGRWLEGSNNGALKTPRQTMELSSRCPTTYMLKPRCSFGNDISLDPFELPDEIPCDGAMNGAGERPVNCFYRKSGNTTILTYKCPAYSATSSTYPKGYRCVYNTSTKQWQVRYMTSTNRTGTWKFDCDAGIDITKESESTVSLAWDDNLNIKYDYVSGRTNLSENHENNAANILAFGTQVEQCKYRSDMDVRIACKQDKNLVINGAIGTCQFVNNITLPSCDSTGCPHTESTVRTNYSGWVYVNKSARVHRITSASPNYTIIQPVGIPCYEVTLNTAGGSENPYPVSTNSAPTSKEEINDIGACVVNTDSTYPAMLECTGNEALDPDDLVPTQSADGAFTNQEKFCWYVTNAYLREKVGSSMVTTSAPYTGWAYFRSWGKLRGRVDTNFGLYQATTGAANGLYYATPCRGGVRKKAPDTP